MNYRSLSTLNKQLLNWLPDLPRDLDLIVAVPRSGSLVATILALNLNLPVVDIDGFLEGKRGSAGSRYRLRTIQSKANLSVLVVDDSIMTGRQMRAVKKMIAAYNCRHRIYYAAVYVAPGKEKDVDYFCEIVPPPRVFEWNIMHSSLIASSCMDLDGVLCRNPDDQDNDDGDNYLRFLAQAPPVVIPSGRVGWLVTCRLEKYRAETEAWLARHRVRYNYLVMMDLKDATIRSDRRGHGRFKAGVYKATEADLFIESSPTQAVEIAELTGWSVFCTETREMVNPGDQRWKERSPRVYGVAITGPDDWEKGLQEALQECISVIPASETFILADEDKWGIGERFADRQRLPFLESNGVYGGPPPDDKTAVRELERMRESGARFFVIGWPAFWWTGYYADFYEYMQTTYLCTRRNELLIIFDLHSRIDDNH